MDTDRAKKTIAFLLEQNTEMLTEIASKNLLEEYGIPVNQTMLATNEEEAVEQASLIGFPVAMKICSAGIPHKSDAKGVCLNIRDGQEVVEAFRKMVQNAEIYDPKAVIDGISIQAMLPSPDVETIIGAKRDPQFGPIIMFGMGGILAELMNDSAIEPTAGTPGHETDKGV